MLRKNTGIIYLETGEVREFHDPRTLISRQSAGIERLNTGIQHSIV